MSVYLDKVDLELENQLTKEPSATHYLINGEATIYQGKTLSEALVAGKITSVAMANAQVEVIDIITLHSHRLAYAKFLFGSLTTSTTFTHASGQMVKQANEAYYVIIDDLRRFSNVNFNSYKFSSAGFGYQASSPNVYDLTAGGNSTSKDSLPNSIQGVADTQLVNCRVQEDGGTYALTTPGPIHEPNLYYVSKIKNTVFFEGQFDNNTKANIIYDAKLRAVSFLMADFSKLEYPREEFHNFLTITGGYEELILNYFVDNVLPNQEFDNYDHLDVYNGVNRKDVFDRLINTEARVPHEQIKLEVPEKGRVDYEILVCVRAGFIHSFPDVRFNYVKYAQENTVFTINTQTHNGFKNMVKNLNKTANILKSYHEGVERFKESGGAIAINMQDEAKSMQQLLGVLNAFFRMKGQGGFPDGLSIDLNSAEDVSTQTVEMVLSDRLYPIHVAASEMAKGNDPVTPVLCNYGMVRLTMLASRRTLGYALQSSNIVRYADGLGIGTEEGEDEDSPVKNTRYTYQLAEQFKEGGNNWFDFIKKFTVPQPFISADERSINRLQYERCLSKLKYSKDDDDKIKEIEEDIECKKLILEERKKAVQFVGDKAGTLEFLGSIEDRLRAAIMSDDPNDKMNILYDGFLNQIEFKTILQEIMRCAAKIAGVDLSAEAICEAIIKKFIQVRGLKSFFESLAVIGLDVTGGVLGQEIENTMTAIPYPATPGDLAFTGASFTDMVQASLDEVSKIEETYPYGPHDPNQVSMTLANGAQEINRYLDQIKQFIDMRELCEKMVQLGLDLPFNLDMFDGFSLEDILPKLPEPPKFKLPRFQRIGSPESSRYWEEVKNTILSILGQQLGNIINSLIRAAIDQCFLEEVPPLGSEQRKLPLNFGPLGTPPSEVFDKFQLPDDRDRMRQFMSRVFDMLNASQSCALLKGEATGRILRNVQMVVANEYAEYSGILKDAGTIKEFFISVGKIFNLDFCEVAEGLSTAVNNICDETAQYNDRVQDLINKGLTEDQARSAITAKINANLEKLKSLAEISGKDPDEFFQGQLPNFDCSVGGVYGTLPPGLLNAKDLILDVIYDAVEAGYNIDIKTIYNVLSKRTDQRLQGLSQGTMASQGTKDARDKIFRFKKVNVSDGDDSEEDDDEPNTNVSTGGTKDPIPFGAIGQEEAPFFELFKLLSERNADDFTGISPYLPPPHGHLYENIEMTAFYGASHQTTMLVPKLEAGVKELIAGNLKTALTNLKDGDPTGLDDATSPQELLTIIEQQVEGQVDDDPNNISKALVNFINGDLKLNFNMTGTSEKDIAQFTISDVSIDTSFEDEGLKAFASQKQKVQRLLDRPFDVDYTAIVESLDLDTGGTFSLNRRNAFAEFMTKAIEKNLPAPGLGDGRDQVKQIFVNGHDKIIYDHFLKFNNHTLTSPAFDKRGFDKMFRKLFPDVDECAEGVSSTMVNFPDLKRYADERISSMFCKTFFDVTRLTSQGMKNVISRGALESLTAAYIRIEILKYVIGVLPLLPVFNLKNVMKSDIFMKNIIESIEGMGKLFPETYKILVENCYDIERFSIRAGGGESTNMAGHAHTYEVDENGNGLLQYAAHPDNPNVRHAHVIKNYKVLEAQSGCYPDCEEKFAVKGVGPHVHALQEEHILLTRDEAFHKIVREQLAIVLPIANNYFSSRMIKFKNVKRIDDKEDFFKAFIYPTYDPGVNFTGPFIYGVKEIEFETFEGQAGNIIYTMFEDEVNEAFEEFIQFEEFGLGGYIYTEGEYSMYNAATKLGTEYLEGKLVSTINLYGGEETLDIAPEGHYNKSIAKFLTPGEKVPFTPLGMATDGPWAYHVTSYLGHAGETFPTDPGITENGSGFYDKPNALMPFVSHFGLFAVEPYMYVDQKDLLGTNNGWGYPEGVGNELGEMIRESGFAYKRYLFGDDYLLPAGPENGESVYTLENQGPVVTRQSQLDPNRNESIMSQLLKFLTPGEFGYEDPGDFIDYDNPSGDIIVFPSPGAIFQDPTLEETSFMAYQNIFDDQGKSDINVWGGDFPRALSTLSNQIKYFDFFPGSGELDWAAGAGMENNDAFFDSTLSQYFNNFCYGTRMVFHVTDPDIVEKLTSVLVSQFGSASDTVLSTFMLENKVFGQEERTVTVNDDELTPPSDFTPGVIFEGQEGAIKTESKSQNKRFTIELFDTKMPIQHAYKCNERYKELVDLGKIDVTEPLGGLKLKNLMTRSPVYPEGLGKPIDIYKQHVLSVFQERMLNSDEYKFLFTHVFDYEHYLAAYTQFILAGNREVAVSNIFKASQRVVENFLINITSGKYSPDELASLNDFHQRSSTTTTQVQGVDIGEMMAALILQTPFLILKGLVEIGDPCVSTATQIQKAVKVFVMQIIGAAKNAISISKSIITAAEAGMQESIANMEQLDSQVEIAKNNLVDLGFTQVVGDNGQIDYQFPVWEGDYEEMGEGDVTAWLSEEQAQTAWSEAYEEWQLLTKQKVDEQKNYSQKQADKQDAENFLNSAEDVVRKIEQFYKLLDPFMLPFIVLGLLPSDAYGVGFPFPIGIGPPMTPFGLMHVIFTAAGINFDDVDAKLRRMIEQIAEDGLEEENCEV